MPSISSILALGLLAVPAVLATPVPAKDKSTSTSTSYSTSYSTSQSTSYSKNHSKSKSKDKTTSTSESTSTTATVASSTTSSPITSTSSTSTSATVASSTTSTSSVVSSTTSTTSSGFKLATPTKTGTSGALASATGMADAAEAIGRYFGTAADIPGTGESSDPYYMAVFNNSHNFDQVTPANIMKWVYLEPQQNVFDFSGADQFVALAEATNKKIRCHNLNWYNQLPTWITNPATPWTNDTLMAALVNHIDKVMGHFGDSCYHWDVVNEAFNDDGTWRNDIWYQTSGPSYISVAFRAANAAKAKYGLKTKLYYNDYNIEYLYPKSYMAQQLVANLTAEGINIDGVGLQSHFSSDFTPGLASQQQNMAAFTALKNANGANVEVAVTELDVRVPDSGSTSSPSASVTAAIQSQQVQFYWNTVNACATTNGCVGVTVWDFDDTYSWVPGTFTGYGWADLYYQPSGANTPLVPKAAIDGIIDGFQNVQPGTYA